MIGLTENEESMRKWAVAAPLLADMVQKFETDVFHVSAAEDVVDHHHSDTACAQRKFSSDVVKMRTAFQELGNPFLVENSVLFNIDSKKVAPQEVLSTVQNAQSEGERQYLEFCSQRLQSRELGLMDPIKKNKFPLFGYAPQKNNSKAKQTFVDLKNDRHLFSKLYIATSEHRTGDLQEFFAHENQAFPLSLCSSGEMRRCTKSDLVKCLNEMSPDSFNKTAPKVHAKILDGPALVHMFNPGASKTFQVYSEKIFLPFLERELKSTLRVDIVWDRYDADSLKNHTRAKRGSQSGVRTLVTPATRVPKDWASFLRESNNKSELSSFLSNEVSKLLINGKEVYTTDGTAVRSPNGPPLAGRLSPCNHEEADTRMLVHVADAVKQGFTSILIRSVDTDVLVLAVYCVGKLPGLEELWLHLGTGQNHQFIAVHTLASALGPEKCKALPMFHAFTGCDTVSSFSGRGKKTAFQAWRTYSGATEGLLAAAAGDVATAMPFLETLVVVMYDRSSLVKTVNESRQHLFTKKSRSLENIPPTLDALQLHTLRSIFQAMVWMQCLRLTQTIPKPEDWGWSRVDGVWLPV